MDAAKSCTATFDLNIYALDVTIAGTGSGTVTSDPVGIDCGTDCSEVYDYGTAVTLTAVEDAGSTFTGWSGAADCSDGEVTMDAAKSCTATFDLNTYTLDVTIAGSGSGTVTSDPAGIDCGTDCSEVYDYDTVVTLTAVADTGSDFAGWSGGGCSGTDDCAVREAADVTVTADFCLLNTFYRDADSDLYGDPDNSIQSCTQPDGYVSDNTDCNDGNGSVNPGAAEGPIGYATCSDAEDNDCDGSVDGADSDCVETWYYCDSDSDTYISSLVTGSCPGANCWPSGCQLTSGDDCNDGDSGINPGIEEVCDGIDNNCDDQIDEGLTAVYYVDSDSDTYGNPDVSQVSCTQPDNYILDGNDCDDNDAAVNPGETEIPYNSIDDDCNEETFDEDLDRDGYTLTQGDCNDNDNMFYPGATELCDNLDNDCDEQVDEDLTRLSSCGVGACAGNIGIETCTSGEWGDDTCDPLEGASDETCDGIDNDCNEVIDDAAGGCEALGDFGVDIDSIYYSDVADREISCDFSNAVMGAQGIVAVPEDCVISRSSYDEGQTFQWTPAAGLDQSVSLEDGAYKMSITQAAEQEVRGRSSMMAPDYVTLLPTEWQFSARISNFREVSQAQRYYGIGVGAGSDETDDLEPEIHSIWFTGYYQENYYENALIIGLSIYGENMYDWRWDINNGGGIILNGYNPADTILDLRVNITDNGRRFSGYYRVNRNDESGWQQAATYVLPDGMETIFGFNDVYPYVAMDTGLSDDWAPALVAAVRDVPEISSPDSNVDLSIFVDVSDSNTAPDGLTVEENIPSGWNVSSASPAYTSYDQISGKIIWEFTGTMSDTTINYTVYIPASETPGAERCLNGNMLYNDTDGAPVTGSMVGDQCLTVGNPFNAYDKDRDWVIGDFELLDSIEEWVDGNLGDFELLRLINFWASGCYHWDISLGDHKERC